MSNPRQHLKEIENRLDEIVKFRESLVTREQEEVSARTNVVLRIIKEEKLLHGTEWEIETSANNNIFISYAGTRGDKLMKPISDLCTYGWHDHFDLGGGIKIHFDDSDVTLSYDNVQDITVFAQQQKLKIKGTNVTDNIKQLKRKAAALEVIAHQFNIK
jgi:hypothetical protein